MQLKKLRIIERDLCISRNTLYAMRDAGLAFYNIGAGKSRPTWAVDDNELKEFMRRPLIGRGKPKKRPQPVRINSLLLRFPPPDLLK